MPLVGLADRERRLEVGAHLVAEVPVGEVGPRLAKSVIELHARLGGSSRIESRGRLVFEHCQQVRDEDRATRVVAERREVVNRAGELSGSLRFETPFAMEERLRGEGISFTESGRIDMKQHLWVPGEG